MTLHIIKNISEMRKTVFFIAAMMSVLFIMTACAKQKSGDNADRQKGKQLNEATQEDVDAWLNTK